MSEIWIIEVISKKTGELTRRVVGAIKSDDGSQYLVVWLGSAHKSLTIAEKPGILKTGDEEMEYKLITKLDINSL